MPDMYDRYTLICGDASLFGHPFSLASSGVLGHSPALSVSTSNSSFSRTSDKNQACASRSRA